MATLRDFTQLSYVATVMGDAWGYTQRSPELQTIPDHLYAAVVGAESDLQNLSDADLDELGYPTHEGTHWEELSVRYPGAIDVIEHIFEDELHAVVFLTPDDDEAESAAEPEPEPAEA